MGAFHLAPELVDQARGGVLVVDFGAQYSQLIARRVRECRVFSAIVPHDIDPSTYRSLVGLIDEGFSVHRDKAAYKFILKHLLTAEKLGPMTKQNGPQ